MGLDVYVGSLTRYYAGDWETIVQQAARESGISVDVVRAEEPPDEAIGEIEEIRQAVDAWRIGLSRALGRELEWDESADAPYFTDKPAWDAYGSLQVLAAYEERGAEKLPGEAVEDWDRNKDWRQAAGGPSPRYALLYAPELWLPVELDGPFEGSDPGGNDLAVGSSAGLLAQLRELNEWTYRGTAGDLARWRHEGAEPRGAFDAAARFGLAVFLDLAEKSVDHRLPMRLDY